MGVRYIVWDTMKGDDITDGSDAWLQLLMNSRKIFNLVSKLNIALTCTFQLALYTTNQRYLDASCLSSSKQIKEVVSELIMMRKLWSDEYTGEKKDCKEIGYTGPLSTTLDTVQTADCWLYEISITHVGVKTEHYDTIKAKDSYYEPLNGTTYPLDPDNPNAYHIDIEVNLGEINQYACDSILHRHIDIVT
jgi:hypothetical protein